MKNLVAFIKKYKERVALTGVVVSFLFFIGGGILLQQLNKKQGADELAEESPKKVKLQVNTKNSPKKKGEKNTAASSTTFFLQPSAETLVDQLQQMQNLKPDVAQKKLRALRVLWPVFFFESREENKKNIASFDISKDGFGVIVEAEYSPERFPELEGVARGRKLWLGGEISGIDLSGTGRVVLQLEYIDFSQGIPGVAVPPQKKK